MKRYIKTAVAAACVGGAATGASASVITGTTYQVEQTGAFDVSFVSQSAGWTGSLYFTGAEVGGIMHPADDSDQYGIGQFLFDNHGTAPGHTVSIGEFEQGTVLHFAYQVFRGNKSNGNTRYVLRTDSPNDLNQFGWKEITPVADSMRTSTLHIEDIVGSGSDYDYNDVRANVIARAVPTPGTATLAGFALIVGCSRRRPKRA